eukprot:g11437.t1
MSALRAKAAASESEIANTAAIQDKLSTAMEEIQTLKKVIMRLTLSNKERQIREYKKKVIAAKKGEAQEEVEERDNLLIEVEEFKAQANFHKERGDKLAKDLAETKRENKTLALKVENASSGSSKSKSSKRSRKSSDGTLSGSDVECSQSESESEGSEESEQEPPINFVLRMHAAPARSMLATAAASRNENQRQSSNNAEIFAKKSAENFPFYPGDALTLSCQCPASQMAAHEMKLKLTWIYMKKQHDANYRQRRCLIHCPGGLFVQLNRLAKTWLGWGAQNGLRSSNNDLRGFEPEIWNDRRNSGNREDKLEFQQVKMYGFCV